MKKGRALVPGSCGELVQGTIEGVDFLVSCPIDLYTEVTVTLNGEDELLSNANKVKSLLAAKKIQSLFGLSEGGLLQVKSQLPESKGMASSTADIAAACWAMAEACGREISSLDVAKTALAIEPSDGVMFSGIALFDHRRGSRLKILGSAPPLGVLVFDLGGQIDTVDFNARKDLRLLNQAKEGKVRAALDLVIQGIKEQNGQLLAQGSTLSALAHQSILSKPNLEEILDEVLKLGAWGINIAHSGTVIGVLFDPDFLDDYSWYARIEKALGRSALAACRLINGGRRKDAD